MATQRPRTTTNQHHPSIRVNDTTQASASGPTLVSLERTTATTNTQTDNYRVIFPNRNSGSYHCDQPVSRAYSCQQNSLIPPNSELARALLMGNATSEGEGLHQKEQISAQAQRHRSQQTAMNTLSGFPEGMPLHQMQQPQLPNQPPRSNLSVLLEPQLSFPQADARLVVNQTPATEEACACACDHLPSFSSLASMHDEADSASGPAPLIIAPAVLLGRSAPSVITSVPPSLRRFSGRMPGTPPLALLHKQCVCEAGEFSEDQDQQLPLVAANAELGFPGRVRRCLSSLELGTLAPPSGSPYVAMLNQREKLESQMTEKWSEKRECLALETPSSSPVPDKAPIHHIVSSGNVSTSSSQSASTSTGNATRKTRVGANENRNRRRAAHNRAIVDELCEIVADLFLAESKLLNPSKYGVSTSLERDQLLKSVQKFVAALPIRYALGAETPSEVLLHMRLMAVVRGDPAKTVVHIINLDNDSFWADNRGVSSSGRSSDSQGANRNLRLVTIACADATGLLEYITKLLGTGGSRVLDADVMLSSDRIVLDRFVVEMNGRLRLDKLANLIEAFLKSAKDKAGHDREHQEDCVCQDGSQGSQSLTASGPLYVTSKQQSSSHLVRRDVHEEIQAGVPLTEMLASPNQSEGILDPQLETLKRHFSMPNELAVRSMKGQHLSMNRIFTPELSNSQRAHPLLNLPRSQHATHGGVRVEPRPTDASLDAEIDPALIGIQVEVAVDRQSMRQKRPLVNRPGSSDLDRIGMEGESETIDFVTVPSQEMGGSEARIVPLIPFDELMLIETIGMGRVSTIYRAAWQNAIGVRMLALKVAMVSPETGDMSHVDELRREADIAARIKHPNVCDLVGVAADAECFCLAYDYCEGGSVLSLLSDSSRYYEYLPIALDVANGMAHLHAKDIIHRDLKPSNILLTRDHRAKIADFGMSVANAGQELTAETGTYRYMAPEVIRHESYSSNADVYSFGVFLWQLITRQVPFASMTPVQAAYAVAEGRRPDIPTSTPPRLKEIIQACWHQDSHQRPSFTYIAMALADYAKVSFSPASVGAQTLQIANEMLATVEGNSNINVDFTTPVPDPCYLNYDSDVGLEI